MKAKTRPVRSGENRLSPNQQVRTEMQTFLQALDSYPARFATNPDITFEQHRRSLAPPAESDTVTGGIA